MHFKIFSGCASTPKDITNLHEDDDVAKERERIYSDRNNTSGDILRMIDLVKVCIKKRIKK